MTQREAKKLTGELRFRSPARLPAMMKGVSYFVIIFLFAVRLFAAHLFAPALTMFLHHLNFPRRFDERGDRPFDFRFGVRDVLALFTDGDEQLLFLPSEIGKMDAMRH